MKLFLQVAELEVAKRQRNSVPEWMKLNGEGDSIGPITMRQTFPFLAKRFLSIHLIEICVWANFYCLPENGVTNWSTPPADIDSSSFVCFEMSISVVRCACIMEILGNRKQLDEFELGKSVFVLPTCG